MSPGHAWKEAGTYASPTPWWLSEAFREEKPTPEQADEARRLLYENGYPLAWADYLHPCFIMETIGQGRKYAFLEMAAEVGGWTP